ncbi:MULTISPECIES: Rnf-Nqr domain containing protein [unclassified Pseudomonas]|uniref:Rnf-Nqr domain containing protein n=1 Tax=unclassified Pseudomonas TaxID=196821 RepID=UPI001BCE3230|nr:Rnf-Nqr domain containing protein [Pseudomonas sp. Pc102]BBP85050.1 hypothetical protein PHLH8_46920 [Pseudomonas sp. Pc102]
MKPVGPLPLLCLAPLLGTSDLLVKALGITLVALPLLTLFGAALPTLRRLLQGRALWLGASLLAGALIGAAQLLMQAAAFELLRALGPFLALLALPCLLLVAHEPAGPGMGLRQGLVFASFALALGALRELLGHASLLAHGEWLGLGALHWQAAADGLPLFASAPGGLILLGLLLALARLKP